MFSIKIELAKIAASVDDPVLPVALSINTKNKAVLLQTVEYIYGILLLYVDEKGNLQHTVQSSICLAMLEEFYVQHKVTEGYVMRELLCAELETRLADIGVMNKATFMAWFRSETKL